MPVFHTKPLGDSPQLRKTEPFVQVSCMYIRRNNCIKLQNRKAVFAPLFNTIQYQFFSNMQSSSMRTHRVTRITDMAASSDIVRVQDIKSVNIPCVGICCDARIGLLRKKDCAAFKRQEFILRKGISLLNDFIPDFYHRAQIFFFILAYYDFHFFFLVKFKFIAFNVSRRTRNSKPCRACCFSISLVKSEGSSLPFHHPHWKAAVFDLSEISVRGKAALIPRRCHPQPG